MKLQMMKKIIMAGLLSGLTITGATNALAMAPASGTNAGADTGGYVPTEVFGSRGGYAHPFMSVSAVSTDNIKTMK